MYAEIEGTEIGEYWTDLCRVEHHTDAISDEFYIALIKEMQKELDFIKENMEVVEEEYPGFGTIRELRDKC